MNWATAAALMALVGMGAVAQSQTSSLYAPVTADVLSSAITAATPAPCPAPLPDTLTGSAGSQTTCMTRPDSTRPTQVQRTTVVTASDGTFSGSWPGAFGSTPLTYWATADADSSSSAPYHCSLFKGTVTATAFSGKCWQIVPTTLPSTVTAIQGAVVSPLANAASNITVRVTGRQ